MSQDEIAVTILSVIASLILWGLWYVPLLTVTRLGPTNPGRTSLIFLPPAVIGLNLLLLKFIAASDVRNDPPYLFMYAAMGAAWTAVLLRITMPLMGYGIRDDVIERGNGAAAMMTWGVAVGISLSFLGANAGEGPGWNVVVMSATLSSCAFIMTWVGMQTVGRTAEEVVVNRSMPTALRAAVLLSAAGLVLGRSVAGDWVSTANLAEDFGRFAWPVAVLLAVDWGMSLLTPTRPKERPPSMIIAAMAGFVYTLTACLYVVWLGPWS